MAALVATVCLTATAHADVLAGLDTIQSASDTDSRGQAEAFTVTASTSGTFDTLGAYLDNGNTAARVQFGLYADNAGKPGPRVASCEVAPPVTGWNTCTTSGAVTSGSRYWLAILQPTGTTGTLSFRDAGSTGTAYGSSSTSLNSLPASFGAGPKWPGSPVSAYVAVTAAPTPTPTPSPTPTPTPSPTPTPTPTPSPTPTPTPTGDCLASAGCYPKPSNDGVGATGVPIGHVPASGCTTSPADGAVLEDCQFNGAVTIATTGAGATYRYSQFTGFVTHAGPGTLTLDYSDFGQASGCADEEILGGDYTVTHSRFNAHVSEGPRVSDSNIDIEDNFIGPMCSNSGDHADGVQGVGGGTNVRIVHNTIDQRTAQDVSSTILIADSSKSADVEDNLLAGGSYTLHEGNDTGTPSSQWAELRNLLVDQSWAFGPFYNTGISWSAANCSGNKYVLIDADYNVTAIDTVIADGDC